MATSKAPTTSRRNAGAGPQVTDTGLSGQPPEKSPESAEHEKATGAKAQATGTSTAGDSVSTGPVVENTAGGLAFERKPSGTRAEPRAKQPTTPERAEIIEARRLEKEIQQAKVNPAQAATGKEAKVGDRVRFLRAAATGWELGTIKMVHGGGAAVEVDGGEFIGLEAGRWEPADGALVKAEITEADTDRSASEEAARLREQGIQPVSEVKTASKEKTARRAVKSSRVGKGKSSRTR